MVPQDDDRNGFLDACQHAILALITSIILLLHVVQFIAIY